MEEVFNFEDMEFEDDVFSTGWVWWDEMDSKGNRISFDDHSNLFKDVVDFAQQLHVLDTYMYSFLLADHDVFPGRPTINEVDELLGELLGEVGIDDESVNNDDTDDETYDDDQDDDDDDDDDRKGSDSDSDIIRVELYDCDEESLSNDESSDDESHE